MKRILRRLRPMAASLRVAAALVIALLLAFPAVASFCNNPVPACSTDVPTSPCFRPPKKKPTCEPKVCDKCTRSPCYTGSGVYATDAVDLQLRTVGFPIVISRHYETAQNIDGPTGYGWASSLSARLYYAVFLKAAPNTYQREADIRMPDGATYRFVENTDGTFTAPQGRFDTLVRNGDGTWDLWLQRTRSRMHFSSTGNLLAIIDDYGNTQTWTYVDDRVTRIEDSSGSGRYVDITYGADGRISDITDHTGRNVHYTYNASGMMTAVSNPAAQSTTYSYVAGKYNPLLSAITDHWGRNVTSITYDPQDRATSYTDKGETYTYTYAYNGVATTTAKTDSSGNRWIYPFGTDGLVLDDVPPGGGAASHVDYYANGLVQTYTDATGVKTHYTYNAQGSVLTKILDYQTANAVEWRYVYDTNFPEKVLTITPYIAGTNNVSPHWQPSKFDYYPPGSTAPGALHHIYEVDDDGSSRVIRTFTYDSHGRPLTETSPSGAVRSIVYDSAGNVQRQESPANNDAGTRPAITYTYDSLGRVLTMTNPLGAVTTYTWDVLNRLTSRTDPIPSASSTLTFTTNLYYDEYDSATQLLSQRSVDPNGAVLRVSRDAYGQIVRQTDPGGGTVQFIWTKGLLTSRLDPNNYATSFTYDVRRRLDTVTYPDSTYERYTYYADDTIASFRDRGARTVTYGYDRLKRMTSATYPGGAAVTWIFTGQKLVTVNDTRPSPSESISRTWTASFQIASETQGSRGTVNWTYDSEGRKATESVTGGATTTYGYYPDGSQRTITWSLVSGSFLHTYDIAGRLAAIQFPNGQTRSYARDGQGRITSIANTHPTTGNVASFAYGYDVNAYTAAANRLGLLTTTTASFPALSIANGLTKFDYDVRRMLVRADYPTGAPFNALAAAWTFDAAGNRTSATTNGVTANYTYTKYGANPLNGPVLQSDGGSNYTYDASGNTITRTGARGNYNLGWDNDNRLTSVSGDESAFYRYDTIHRRVTTTTTAGATSHLYSGYNLIADSGASSAQYLFTSDLDQPLAMFRGGQAYYYSVDGLGSVVAVNDAAGAVVNSYAYDAWGVPVARNETVASPFGFTARPFGAAGLTDHRFRSYEAATGTFRSVDPLIAMATRAMATKAASLAPQYAEYAYADGLPTMLTDPFGLRSCPEACFAEFKIAYDICTATFIVQSGVCLAGFKLCLLFSANPAICGPAWVVCQAGVAAIYAVCLWGANRRYDECLKGCQDCPVPPGAPPPPSGPPPMMPSHPSGPPPMMPSH